MVKYLTEPGNSDDQFAIMPITNASRDKVGFRITRVAATPAIGADVRWEYESDATRHPRPAPYADRGSVDLDPGEQFVHWFPFQPHEGQLYVSVTVPGGVPLADYERVDLDVFEVLDT
ncbi:MAG: hypothetical protein JXA57_21010 [Armatimonadetes bacterium]|nr:hypothetical protein [Armatimonadota bacterium]